MFVGLLFILQFLTGCGAAKMESRPLYPRIETKEDYILIDKSENVLYFYRRGKLVKRYPVATGRQPQYTPEGVFVIVLKSRSTGFPRFKTAQFGTRWMGIAVPPEADRRWEKGKDDDRGMKGLKYGIHGTNAPESIGSHASGGCIRMDNHDVIELYERVSIGTKVEIRP